MTSDITTTDPVAAQKLWDALREAGVDAMPRTVAHVEEALFRCYLPLARTMARRHTPDGDDHEDTAQVGMTRRIPVNVATRVFWRQTIGCVGSAGVGRCPGAAVVPSSSS